jgi:hypothetical protein
MSKTTDRLALLRWPPSPDAYSTRGKWRLNRTMKVSLGAFSKAPPGWSSA